jgi:hypothetical protein
VVCLPLSIFSEPRLFWISILSAKLLTSSRQPEIGHFERTNVFWWELQGHCDKLGWIMSVRAYG